MAKDDERVATQMSDVPHILGINPWIHDFAAYDVWAKPLGLFMILSILERQGFKVSYMDCLNRFHPNMPEKDPKKRHGRGPYLKAALEKPECLKDIKRNFSRYGIKPTWFEKDLKKIPKPDVILVTSGMTYWYKGVQETIEKLRVVFPDVPIILGGIYTTLYPSHAKETSGADIIITGTREEDIVEKIAEITGFKAPLAFDPTDFDSYPHPAFHLQTVLGYIPLLTSKGCPFSCAYCASSYLNPRYFRKSPEAVVAEIFKWHKDYGVVDFAFYDDALLVQAETHMIPILEEIVQSNISVRFHTPNALHIRELTKPVTDLMHRAGFHTIRLGLETTAFEARNGMDKKVTEKEFGSAVTHLKQAGFKKEQLGAYLLVGLPEQSFSSVEQSVKVVLDKEITPIPAYYSPIPHTPFWEKALSVSRYDLNEDPLFTNNAIFPCIEEGFSWKLISYLKSLTHEGNV